MVNLAGDFDENASNFMLEAVVLNKMTLEKQGFVVDIGEVCQVENDDPRSCVPAPPSSGARAHVVVRAFLDDMTTPGEMWGPYMELSAVDRKGDRRRSGRAYLEVVRARVHRRRARSVREGEAREEHRPTFHCDVHWRCVRRGVDHADVCLPGRRSRVVVFEHCRLDVRQRADCGDRIVLSGAERRICADHRHAR